MLSNFHPYTPPLSAYTAPSDDPMLALWLGNTPQPWYGEVAWRVWTTRAGACTLLVALDSYAIPVRIAGVLEPKGVWLYLWLGMPNPCIDQLLGAYDAGRVLVYAEQVRGGQIWATGAALRRALNEAHYQPDLGRIARTILVHVGDDASLAAGVASYLPPVAREIGD